MNHEQEKNQIVTTWQLGQWCYCPASGEISYGKKNTRLSNQLNAVLKLLVDDAPNVVTRQKFLDVIWTDKIVNEDALSRTIAELRKELGDTASQAAYIKTIPKKGYQLTAKLEPIAEQKKRRRFQAVSIFVIFSVIFAIWFIQQATLVESLQASVAGAERLTSRPGMEQQAVISHDGAWLSFSHDTAQKNQIIIQNLTDSNLIKTVELAGQQLSSPYYLPETDELFFTVKDENRCWVKKYDFQKDKFTELAECIFLLESRTLNFIDSEELVLFVAPAANENSSAVIYQMNKDGLNKKQLTTASLYQDLDPHVSPDGKWLSFSRGNHSVRNIWLKNRLTDESFAITSGEHYSVSHTWYDDEHIVFDSDSNGSRQLWLVNVNDQEPQLIGVYGAQHPSVDAQRHLLTYQEVSYEANIWLLQLATGEYSRIIHSTKYDNNPAFSPDGKRMIYSSNRQDKGSIWHYDFLTQTDKLLLSVDEAKLTRPFWYQNGEKILVTKNDEQGYSTFVYDIATGEQQVLEFGEANASAQSAGDAFYALSKSQNHANQIIKLSQGQVERLPILKVSRFIALNEKQLVFTRLNQTGLFLYDLANHQEKNLIPTFSSNAMNLWTAVNQSIYYDQAGKQAGLWRYDLLTGESEWLSQHRPSSVGASLSVSHDESKVLITQTDRAESDIFKVRLQ